MTFRKFPLLSVYAKISVTFAAEDRSYHDQITMFLSARNLCEKLNLKGL